MSIKYKIAFLFAILCTIVLLLIGYLVYVFSEKEQTAAFKNRLKNKAQSTSKLYQKTTDNNNSTLKILDENDVASLQNKNIVIINSLSQYQYVFSDVGTDTMHISKSVIENTLANGIAYFFYQSKQGVAIYNNSPNKFIVAIAATNNFSEKYISLLKKIFAFSLLLGVPFAFVVGLFFSNKLLKPLKKIIGEVNLISTNNLSKRIDVATGSNDELNALSNTFNLLLDRLQDSFAIQGRFISNASHELSTPLTSISNQLEVAMQKNRESDEYKRVMASVYEDVKTLQQLTKSLLDIAKTGKQGGIDLEKVRVDEILLKTISDLQKQNKNYTIELNFEDLPDNENLLTVFGNPNLLYISFKNIIENGCKYSDNGESIVTTFFNNNFIIIKVANKGDIIAEADIQNIFQPFFRTDSVQNKPGFGLGLTLTKRILSLHKGSIQVESNYKTGTVFTIQLPNMAKAQNKF